MLRGVTIRESEMSRRLVWRVCSPVRTAVACVMTVMALSAGSGTAAEPLSLKLEGIVEPRARVAVANQVTGIVNRVAVVAGQKVEVGDPLFEIDAAEFQIAVSAAQAALDESIARLNLAEDVAERQSRLAERGSGAEARATQATIEVTIAKAVVARQESALRGAELALKRTRIAASIAGIVSPRVAPGTFVEAEAGTSLGEIVQTDPILVGYSVSYEDRQRSLKKAGTTSARDMFDSIALSLVLPSGEAYAHRGRPMFESAEVDRKTGLLTTWAEFSNPDGILVPGLGVQVLSTIQSAPTGGRQ